MEVQRIQPLASLCHPVESIPEDFIQPETEQPTISTYKGPVPKIPTIDLSDPDREKIVNAISEASRDWGIFQVVNHGIPDDLISRLQRVGKEFFELPQEEKEKYATVPGSRSVEGYGTKIQEDQKVRKTWVNHLFHKIWPPTSINHRFWPQNPPSYREVNEEYAGYMRGVVDKLFALLSLGLGLKEDALKAAVGGEELEYNLKINYYPPCPRPDLALGIPPHTDLSTLTILVPNEVPGLQILKDYVWIDAEYIPNALIIHIGDQIEILSNGKYRSVLHRSTVEKERTRMSWPVFLEPPADLVIGPLAELVDEQNPPKFEAKKFSDYMFCKLHKSPQ